MPPESPLAGPPGTVTPPGEPKPPATPGPAVEPKPGEPAAKPPAGPTEVAMNSSTKPPVEPPAGPGKEPGVGPILEPAAPVGPAQPLGRLVSDKQLLLAFDKKAAGWVRAPSKGVLVSRDRVLALPTFRPEVGLSTGLTLRLLGGTEIELLPGDAQMPMGINVLFGRAVLVPLANPGSRLRVAIGERAGVITFAQAEAVAALEVTPVRSPGTDPEKVPSQLNATLVAVSGELTWEQPGLEKPLKLSAPAQVTFQGPAVVGPAAAELPKWINAETLSALDARASVAVEQALQSDRPAVQTLLELAEHRQREVRWLASRSLVYLGRFDDLVSAMNVADPKSDWQEYVAKLSEAIALGAENAAAVRAALEKQYGAGAGELYRMLWGYSQKDLEDGDDAKLVAGLDHDNIAFRALSFWNLKEITGAGRLYRPELPAAQRKQSVQRWKECLDKKEIRHRPGEPGVKPPPPPEPPIELN